MKAIISAIAIVIAVSFASFNAAAQTRIAYVQAQEVQNEVTLTWATTADNAESFYVVEFSPNGVLFAEVGRVNATTANTANTYSFTTTKPAGEGFFRVRQVVANGTTTVTSAVALLDNDSDNAMPTLRPETVQHTFAQLDVDTFDGI